MTARDMPMKVQEWAELSHELHCTMAMPEEILKENGKFYTEHLAIRYDTSMERKRSGILMRKLIFRYSLTSS